VRHKGGNHVIETNSARFRWCCCGRGEDPAVHAALLEELGRPKIPFSDKALGMMKWRRRLIRCDRLEGAIRI